MALWRGLIVSILLCRHSLVDTKSQESRERTNPVLDDAAAAAAAFNSTTVDSVNDTSPLPTAVGSTFRPFILSSSLEEELHEGGSPSVEVTTVLAGASDHPHPRPSATNTLGSSVHSGDKDLFNSALPLTELVVIGVCLIFGIVANSIFILVLRTDLNTKAHGRNYEASPTFSSSSSFAAKNLSMRQCHPLALPSTRVFLESSFILDTLTLIFLAFSVFPFHSPFYSDYPFLHLVLGMTSFSLLDVVLLTSAWTGVALAFDLVCVTGDDGGGGVGGGGGGNYSPDSQRSSTGPSSKSAVVIVVLISTLSFLLSIPSFILFQNHLKDAVVTQNNNVHRVSSPSVTSHFEHEHHLESHYQLWSKLSLRYWLPLTLIALAVSACIILLKRRTILQATVLTSADVVVADRRNDAASGSGIDDRESARRSAVSSDDHNGVACFNRQQQQQQQPLLSLSSSVEQSESRPFGDYSSASAQRIGFSRTCVAKLLVNLFFALPHFVLTTVLYLDSGHLDVFDVLRTTADTTSRIGRRGDGAGQAREGRTRGDVELSTAQTIVCLTSILFALQSVASFFVFVVGSSLVRSHFKKAFKVWCHGSKK